MSRDIEYAARLFLAWVNERYGRAFAPSSLEADTWTAADESAGDAPGSRMAIVADRLSEAQPDWEQRCRELETRLDETRPGSYVLWVPPGGSCRRTSPTSRSGSGAWFWRRRVWRRGDRARCACRSRWCWRKVRDEGGYANVVGGLSRHWTAITAEGERHLLPR